MSTIILELWMMGRSSCFPAEAKWFDLRFNWVIQPAIVIFILIRSEPEIKLANIGRYFAKIGGSLYFFPMVNYKISIFNSKMNF